MEIINAVITGVSAYVPEHVITNDDIAKVIDTSDEWIMTRIGIKERRVLKGEGLGTSYMGVQAVKALLEKTNTDPSEIDAIFLATVTPDYKMPAAASVIAHHVGCRNAFTFDIQAACSGFILALDTASKYINSGQYKKIVVVGGDKMTSLTNCRDRATSPIFADGCGAVLLEATDKDYGVLDSIFRSDGVGVDQLIVKRGGSAYPPSLEQEAMQDNYIYQNGKFVFKHAVESMSSAASELSLRNNLSNANVDWVIPHQANLRIIDAVSKRLEIEERKVVINIEKYGNTCAGTIPICLWEWEEKFKKGDNIILVAFGAGFTWGAVYMKWGYNSN